MNVEALKDIREELKELRLLYKELVEKLIPSKSQQLKKEKPTKKKTKQPTKKD